MADQQQTEEWGVRSTLGTVFECRDEQHALAMSRSTSPVVGPMRGRVIVHRRVTPWVAGPNQPKES